jgi:predicted deacylase
MHGGGAAGLFASLDLIRKLTAGEICGEVKVVPIVSMQSLYSRSLQIAPLDDHEPHYMWPGVPDGSYSEHLIDMIFRATRDADAVLDLHGGELTQALTPYAGAPWRGKDDALWRSCLD